MFEELKGYIVGIASRWLLKVFGTWLATIGYQGDDALMFVSGIVAGIVGVGISIYQHIKAKKDASSPNLAPVGRSAPISPV